MRMRGSTKIATVIVLVAALVMAPVAAAAPAGNGMTVHAQQSETPTGTATHADANNSSVSPGEKLSGVVGVQQAELDGEIAERTFGIKIAQANSSDAKAEVVAETLEEIEQRLRNLEERKQRLQEARANGSISEGKYRAEMAELAANVSATERLTNSSAQTAESLPKEVLRDNGINVTAIQRLKTDAENLTGHEVAAIAKSIAGDGVGQSMAGTQNATDMGSQLPDAAANRSDNAGQQSDQGQDSGQGQHGAGEAGDVIDQANTTVQQASEQVDRANRTVTTSSSDEAQAALERAQENLTKARETLADAQEASSNGDSERALELARQSVEYAEAALEHSKDALELADGSDAGDNDAGNQSGSDGAP